MTTSLPVLDDDEVEYDYLFKGSPSLLRLVSSGMTSVNHNSFNACVLATCMHQEYTSDRMAYIVMAYTVMAYIDIVMAYIVMAYIVMAYIVMAYIVMAHADEQEHDLYSYGLCSYGLYSCGLYS